MQNRLTAIFFAIPLLLGFGLVMDQSATGQRFNNTASEFIYRETIWLLMWTLAFSLCRFLFHISHWLRRHRLTAYIISAYLAMLIMRPLLPLIYGASYVQAPPDVPSLHLFPVTVSEASRFLYCSLFPLISWCLANLFFDNINAGLYFREQLHEDTSQGTRNDGLQDQSSPFFLREFPALTLKDVLAVSADDHYIKVITTGTERLIHGRFKDCLLALNDYEQGLQIHRSHWVNRQHIREIERQGRKATVVLNNNQRFPVSHTYLSNIIQLAEKNNITCS